MRRATGVQRRENTARALQVAPETTQAPDLRILASGTPEPGHSGCQCHGLERPDPLASGCPCAGCEALRAELVDDASLDPHIGAHLLIRGWPGGLSRGEHAYVQAHADWARAAAERARRLIEAQTPEQRAAFLRAAKRPQPLSLDLEISRSSTPT